MEKKRENNTFNCHGCVEMRFRFRLMAPSTKKQYQMVEWYWQSSWFRFFQSTEWVRDREWSLFCFAVADYMAFSKRGNFARSASLQIFMKHWETYIYIHGTLFVSIFSSPFKLHSSWRYNNMPAHLTLKAKVIAIPLHFASLCLSHRNREKKGRECNAIMGQKHGIDQQKEDLLVHFVVCKLCGINAINYSHCKESEMDQRREKENKK